MEYYHFLHLSQIQTEIITIFTPLGSALFYSMRQQQDKRLRFSYKSLMIRIKINKKSWEYKLGLAVGGIMVISAFN